MKKTILTFGIISGVIAAVLMCTTVPLLRDTTHGNRALIIGYATIVLAALLIFFGIRSYRDNIAGGSITFGRAFTIGLGITLISCAIYVVAWEVVYFTFLPHFMDSYFAAQIQRVQASGGTPEAVQAKVAAIRQSQIAYQNPLINALYTFIEPFPVDLLLTIVSAAILRRKPKAQTSALPATA